eukprot:836603_1
MTTISSPKDNDALVIAKRGYKLGQKITTTLQGEIYELTLDNKIIAVVFQYWLRTITTHKSIYTNHLTTIITQYFPFNKYVIKKTYKKLHESRCTIQDGKMYAVKEDILSEKKMLQYIKKQNPRDFIVKFIDFFESKHCYYMVMQNG